MDWGSEPPVSRIEAPPCLDRESSQALGCACASMRATVIRPLLCYLLTSTVVVAGVVFGRTFIEVARDRGSAPPATEWLSAFAAEDGRWYTEIVTQGYSYDVDTRSSVAFLPLYPLLATAVMRSTGVSATAALLIVSKSCLAGAFILAALYARQKVLVPRGFVVYTLMSFGLMPATLFFRMAYSESLFILLTIATLFVIGQRGPPWMVALLGGLSTVARAVGIGLLAVFALYCWHRAATFRQFALHASALLPLACSGIAVYMAMQAISFGDPFAFVQTQSHWGIGSVPWLDKLASLCSFEPVWQIYDSASPCYWRLGEPPGAHHAFFSWTAVNPLYSVTTAILILIGARRGWLSSYDTAVAAALLLIPYVTRAPEMLMGSQARFCAIVFPMYLVLGNILARMPEALAASVLGLCGFYLGAFAALFATWHGVY